MQSRLGTLMEGTYGRLFAKRPALDWREVTTGPSMTYLSLSALHGEKDTKLFGRVLIQDLKQVCDIRETWSATRGRLLPTLVCWDEFAALEEPTQITGMLVQARAAEMPMLLATQLLPEDGPIRKAALGLGVLIAHRVGHEDAEALAKEFGTEEIPDLTQQTDLQTGESRMGSVRMVREFNVHPDVVKRLQKGEAAVLSREREHGRWQIVKVAALSMAG